METQVPFSDWSTLIGRFEKWLDKFEKVTEDHGELRQQFNAIINSRVRRDSLMSKYVANDLVDEFIRSVELWIDTLEHRDMDLAREGSNLLTDLRWRREKNPTQKDRFFLRYGMSMNPDINNTFGMSPNGTKKAVYFTTDAHNKDTLVRLYNWVVENLSGDKDTDHMISALDHDIYDYATWTALMDAAEEKGIDTEDQRRKLRDLFIRSQPKVAGKHQLKGWHP